MSAALHTLISGVGYGNESGPQHQRIYDEIVKEVLEEARSQGSTVTRAQPIPGVHHATSPAVTGGYTWNAPETGGPA